MTFQPPIQNQFQPVTTQAKYDCVPATCALGVDRATVGAKFTNHAVIRTASGVTGRGLSYAEAVAATQKATGVVGQVRLGITPEAYKVLLLGGHALSTSIDTNATAGTKYQTGLFRGDHSIYANVYYPTNDSVNIKDVGTGADYMNWPFTLLVKAALLRTANHGINVIVWRDTEGVQRVGVGDRFRASPSMTATDKGPVKPGQVYTVTSTFNGGAWTRADGSGVSHGWHRVPGNLFTTGKALR